MTEEFGPGGDQNRRDRGIWSGGTKIGVTEEFGPGDQNRRDRGIWSGGPKIGVTEEFGPGGPKSS